jgi:hypothetical protein
MADSIDPCIQVTTDICSRHVDKKLPLLDLKVWIGESVTGEHKILHEFYMKDVASRAVIPVDSSHSGRMKHNVMVNEVCRILKNCSIHIKWGEVAKHISYFMRRLQFSGYDQSFRYKVLKQALKEYDSKRQQYGESRSMFPNRPDAGRGNRRERQKKVKWYSKGGQFDTVMFVEATPGSLLRRKVQEVAKRNRVKVKVVERVGCTIKSLLQKSNPFKILKCGRTNCVICKIDSDFDCRTRGCVYEIRCKECNRKYRGQTGRSTYERTGEHMDDWEKKRDRCPLWRHSMQYHSGAEFEYEIKIVSRCFGKPTRRLITEAVAIDELTPDMTMNNKAEWSYVNLSKVNIV